MPDDPIDVLEAQEIPPAVGEAFRVAFDLAATPTTLADWVTAVADLVATVYRDDIDAVCLTSSSPHSLEVDGDTCRCRGVFDALLLAHAREDDAGFVVRSRDPISDDPVTISRDDQIAFDPSDGILSVAVSADVVSPDYFEAPPRIAYARFNQYTNAFVGEETYRTWARQTEGVPSMALTLPVAIDLSRAMAAALPASVFRDSVEE